MDLLMAMFNEPFSVITKEPGNDSNPKMGTWLNKQQRFKSTTL